jgi:leader peptidase (prepilin peptidase) / N-methyltransferase
VHRLLLIAIVIGFACGGGWVAARATQAFSTKKASLVVMIAACGVIAAWACLVVFGTTELALTLALGWALALLAAIDWLAFRLPDIVTLPLVAAGLVAAQLLPGEHVLDHLAAAALGYGAFWAIAWSFRRLRGKEGLGLGDAKLAAVAGGWLGLEPLPSVLLLASVAGILWVLARALFRGRAAFGEKIPFGVPLCAAIWIVWLYGPLTVAWPALN